MTPNVRGSTRQVGKRRKHPYKRGSTRPEAHAGYRPIGFPADTAIIPKDAKRPRTDGDQRGRHAQPRWE